jgi:dienelactone hydrolase
MSALIVRDRRIGGITTLEVFQDDGEPNKPLVILYHGWTGKKDDCVPWGSELARNGFFAVSADAYNHGARRQANRFVMISDTIMKTAGEVNTIIEAYADRADVDATRTGLAGISMGGGVALYYLTMADRRIRAALSSITSPEWSSVLSSPSVAAVLKESDSRYSDEVLAAELGSAGINEPIGRYQEMKGVPLMLIQGEVDPLVPVESMRDFYRTLQGIVDEPEDLRLIIYPGIGHTIIAEMTMEVVRWFQKHLVLSPRAA